MWKGKALGHSYNRVVVLYMQAGSKLGDVEFIHKRPFHAIAEVGSAFWICSYFQAVDVQEPMADGLITSSLLEEYLLVEVNAALVNGKGSSNWLWSTWVGSCFLPFLNTILFVLVPSFCLFNV